jgi:exodeoxyribonuclease V alpha subunit
MAVVTSSRGERELIGQFVEASHFFADANGGGTLVGRLASGEVVRGRVEDRGDLEEGLSYRFVGRWDEHPRFGRQFAFSAFVVHAPHGRAAVIKYLTRFAANVGRKTAERLYDLYGADAAAVLAREPERVAGDGLMTEAQVHEAAASLRELADQQVTLIDLLGLFDGKGFSHALAHACFAKWGVQAPAVVQRNPFALLVARMPGCGFCRCDALWLDLGLPPQRLKRQALAAWHFLNGGPSGHTWRPADAVANAIREGTGDGARPRSAVALGLRARLLARRRDGDGVLWLAEGRRARNEATVANRVRELLAAPPSWANVPRDVLSDHQHGAVLRLVGSPVALLLGQPGTGKTFTAAAIIRAQVARYGAAAVRVAAPTGKAATRCAAALHRYNLPLEATTIHRLLEATPGGPEGFQFKRNEQNRLDCRVLVVDETSMLDVDLAARLFSACRPGTNVLLVGDRYQLPPVQHGATLRDMIDAGLPCAELTEIRRNAGAIVQACAAIKDGRHFETFEVYDAGQGRNLVLIQARTAADRTEAVRRVMGELRRSEGLNPLLDVQVLCATNRTRRDLNAILQALLNSDGEAPRGGRFRRGDKVICLRNRFLYPPRKREQPVFVANGDVGLVEATADRTMTVRLTDPDRLVQVPLGRPQNAEADDDEEESKDAGCDFDLAYCCTGHKFQGSECPVVVAVIEPEGWKVAAREWHYTVLSRAQTLCVLVGQVGVIEQQCRRVSLRDRRTFLAELLREGVSP